MKCVLTVAGLGTRLLPLTKELPKEMLPIYVKSKNRDLVLKPILQVIFESLAMGISWLTWHVETCSRRDGAAMSWAW